MVVGTRMMQRSITDRRYLRTPRINPCQWIAVSLRASQMEVIGINVNS